MSEAIVETAVDTVPEEKKERTLWDIMFDPVYGQFAPHNLIALHEVMKKCEREFIEDWNQRNGNGQQEPSSRSCKRSSVREMEFRCDLPRVL